MNPCWSREVVPDGPCNLPPCVMAESVIVSPLGLGKACLLCYPAWGRRAFPIVAASMGNLQWPQCSVAGFELAAFSGSGTKKTTLTPKCICLPAPSSHILPQAHGLWDGVVWGLWCLCVHCTQKLLDSSFDWNMGDNITDSACNFGSNGSQMLVCSPLLAASCFQLL